MAKKLTLKQLQNKKASLTTTISKAVEVRDIKLKAINDGHDKKIVELQNALKDVNALLLLEVEALQAQILDITGEDKLPTEEDKNIDKILETEEV